MLANESSVTTELSATVSTSGASLDDDFPQAESPTMLPAPTTAAPSTARAVPDRKLRRVSVSCTACFDPCALKGVTAAFR